ncbi:MAG: tetratricopeptide repeat protein [Coleofasciculaceae cyanobacterium RL_1_1]|nr:tetratricopeptide repeat protein [Coleofasciculaceae cyanobacterium RL_1_1]
MDIVLSLVILSILILISYERKFQVVQRCLDQYRTGYHAWIHRRRVQRFQVKSTPTQRSQSPAGLELQNQLIRLFDGDRQQAELFVANVRFGQYGKSDSYYWSLAIQRKRYISEYATLKRQGDVKHKQTSTRSNSSQDAPATHLKIENHNSQQKAVSTYNGISQIQAKPDENKKNIDSETSPSTKKRTKKTNSNNRLRLEPTKANPQLTFLGHESSKYSESQTQKIQLHLEAASDLVKQHKFDLALPILNRLTSKYPDCLQARVMRGRAFYELGKYDAAITDFDYVIQQEPNHIAAHRDRGLVEYDQRNYLAVIASLSIVIGHFPSAKLFKIRGNAYKGLGQNDSAIRDYLSAKKIYSRQGAKHQVRQLEKQIEILYPMIEQINPVYSPKSSIKLPKWQLPANEKQSFPFEQGRAKDKKCLLQLLDGDRQKANRLLELARSQHPNRSIHWYFEKALYDLKRDRS